MFKMKWGYTHKLPIGRKAYKAEPLSSSILK